MSRLKSGKSGFTRREFMATAGAGTAALFIGDKGNIYVDRSSASQEGVPEMDLFSPMIENSYQNFRSCLHDHTWDFLTCVRTRQQPISHAPGQTWSQLPCHLANIALRLGRKLHWNPQREEFTGDDEANGLLSRSQRSPYQIK